MILDGRGRLVWFKQLTPPDVAANLRVQRYRGRRVLTWWQGPVTAAAYGLGEGVIADSLVPDDQDRAGRQRLRDGHPRVHAHAGGDALFTIYAPVVHNGVGAARRDRPAGRRPRPGWSCGSGMRSATSRCRESYATPANSAFYDAFHINSIQALPRRARADLRARHVGDLPGARAPAAGSCGRWAARRATSASAPGARFWFQHDAQLLRGGRVSMFDDEAGPPQKAPSLARRWCCGSRRRAARRWSASLHRPGTTSAQSEGSVQQLPGGGRFVGFGAEPWFTQFAARRAGRVRRAAAGRRRQLPRYRFPWRGAAGDRPGRGRCDDGARLRELERRDRRRALAGGRPCAWLRSGLRDADPGERRPGRSSVRALDARGHVLGTVTAS